MHLHVGEARTPLAGEISIPSSKYHAHRALILASLAPGTSHIIGPSGAQHVRSTIDVLRGLGTAIDVTEDGFTVRGGPYRPNLETVSVGSSGTTLYFMTGLASLADTPFTLTGQKYFERRPVGPLLEALEAVGVRLESARSRPPITIRPSQPAGGRVSIAGKLSQWISGLLILAPFATGRTVVEVEGEFNERSYVELTVEMMRRFGLEVAVSGDWRRFEIEPGQTAAPADIVLPPDIGSAAFGLAATALHPADVLFRGLIETEAGRVDHPEGHFIAVMSEMGLPMELDGAAGGLRVRHDGIRLRGVEVDCRTMPDMLPALAAIGQFAEGETRFRNIEHVRLKESDRVVSMLQLNRMGGNVAIEDDQLVVRGVEDRLTGAPLSSFNDHRVHMALTIAASRASGVSSLTYPNAYRISYPSFLDDMRSIGIPMRVGEALESDGEDGRAHAVSAQPTVESVAIDQAAETPIVDWVARWVRERPADTAVVDVRTSGTRAWSWRGLDEAADRTAALLLELGVEPGETVAYQLPNWGEFVVLTLAAMKVGAVCCPLMPIFREREVAQALERSRARVLVIPERFRGRDHLGETRALVESCAAGSPESSIRLEHVLVVCGDVAPDLTESGGVRWHDFAAATTTRAVDRAAIEARKPAPEAIAQLLFTSGTSGEPKGVLHRYDALTRAAAMQLEHLGLGRDDRIFIPTPLAHQTGLLYGMWLAFILGSTQILQDVWDPVRGVRTLREWNGTFAQAATPFLADLVEVVEEGEAAPSSLRIFVVTGAAVPRALAEKATHVLDASICGAWGSTESCLGALTAPGDPREKVWGTDGRALAGTSIRVTNDSGKVLGPNLEGHFEVHSRCLFEGYLDRPDLTEAALTPDGWYRSGDLATIDEDGYLRITGRVKDIVNRGGEKVPVAEIEQLLHRHPLVADVAIVAMPDQRLGERACAFVVLRQETSPEGFDLVAMRGYLDLHKVATQYWPERLELIAELPRTPSGKIQKFVLRERARELRPTHPTSTDKEPVS
ncbi:MAG: 3-phosphoshikimate 1-carboxyvinyltransferase [Solirubrobacterales bacterium]